MGSETSTSTEGTQQNAYEGQITLLDQDCAHFIGCLISSELMSKCWL